MVLFSAVNRKTRSIQIQLAGRPSEKSQEILLLATQDRSLEYSTTGEGQTAGPAIQCDETENNKQIRLFRPFDVTRLVLKG